ncbi:MAG: Na+/H+ antiporter NhaC, partial [Halieaceae bacterium]
MIHILRSLIIGFALLLALPSMAGELTLDAPRVLLTEVSASVEVTGLDDRQVVIRLNGQPLVISRVGEVATAEVLLSETGTVTLEVLQDGDLVSQSVVPVVPGWVSVLPPLIAILLSFILRSVVPSLFAGLVVGAWAINGLTAKGAFIGVFDTMSIYVLDAMIDRDHSSIILFSLLIGGMVGIISRNGGMVGIVNLVIPIAKTPKRGQAVIASLGLAIFFDDYANTMIVGNATRPVSDHLKISREKLAYLVDSTAAPVATVAVITTWIGFQVGLIEDAVQGLEGISQSAYSLFLSSIPYSFYPFLAIFFVYLVVLTGKDFGPMYRAELRARTTGQVSRTAPDESSDKQMDDFYTKTGVQPRAVNALVPIACLIGGVIGGMYISGEGNSMQDIVGSADAYLVLIWASLLSCMSAFVLTIGQRILTLNELIDAWIVGARFMLTGI